MLSKLSIKQKLWMVTIIIVFVGLLTVGMNLLSATEKRSSIEKLEKLTQLSTKISLLVHETQKERGATAGFISSSGKKFAQKLKQQREATDKRLEAYNTYRASLSEDLFSDEMKQDMQALEVFIKRLPVMRSQVDTLYIPLSQAIHFYTAMNEIMLQIVPKTAMVSPDIELENLLSSYANFLKSKERAGIERAVLSSTFTTKSFASGMREKLISLIAEQDRYLDAFLATAPKEIRIFYKKKYQGKAIDEVLRMRKKALDGHFDVDSLYWFDTITDKIKGQD